MTSLKNRRIYISKQDIPVAVVCLMFLFSALPTKAGGLSNEYCPVTTSELAEEQFFVDYEGRRIYFCCNKCKKEFLSNPDAYLANLESSEPETESADDQGEEERGHGETLGKAVGASHDEDGDSSHDHATDHDESSSIIAFAGKFHPMLTHFPIALVLSALLFAILAAVFQIQTMDYVSVYSIYLAALTGIGTVILGLAAGSAANYPSFLVEYLSWHRLLGISTGVITLLTAYLGKRHLQQSLKQTAWLYRASLLVNATLVGVTGHFGAMLVFGPDIFKF